MSLDLQAMQVKATWRYPVSRTKVFKALSEGRLFATCGGRMSAFEHEFKVGGRYQYGWGTTGSCHGEYLEIVPEEKLRFSWSEPDGHPPSEVTVTLSTRGAFTIIDLVHAKVPRVEGMHEYNQGWTEVLALFLDELDGTTLRISRDYDVPAADMFRALAAGALFRTIGGPDGSTHDFREGGSYYFKVGKNDDYVRGNFVKISPSDHIKFTWATLDSGVAVEDTDVLLYLKTLSPKSTRLWIVHDGLTVPAVRASHAEGWTDCLEQLATTFKG